MSQSIVLFGEDGQPQHLVIAPHTTQVIDSDRGQVLEVNDPEGMELNLECYVCRNPLCDCPTDYYATVSIKISRAEYDRIQLLPGWSVVYPETEDQDGD